MGGFLLLNTSKMKMAEDKKTVVLRGCIKTTRGPWIVHKTKKDGSIVTKYRFPSDEERQKNKQREKKRRSVTRNVFRGLREHGKYNLPKHADSNDLLVALCEEAGWHVEEDGTIYRKKLVLRMSNLESRSGYNPPAEEDIKFPSSTASSVVHSLGDCPPTGHPEINLTLSLASNFI